MRSQSSEKEEREPPGSSPDGALTPTQFHILLALARSPRHGYGIMQDIEDRTEGAVEVGPGTLYRSIKQLLQRGLIREVEGEAVPDPSAGPQRRSYFLTDAGRLRAAEEARRLREVLGWATDALALEGGKP